ncbi:MAG: aspartate aminotransferase family protein, partial [Candidatus Eremiobacteraeota bacterium]|nr:aspartate aminotransferase family protein [Candidatus Eremiobacteraeota bacterium]
MNDDHLEELHGKVPGLRTGELSPLLAEYESQGITALGADFPIFWESASGANVYDVDGNCYLDLTAAFGVANTGHTNAYVAAAIADQAVRLMHSMGDVHPTEVRVQLLEKLAAITPEGLSKSFLCSTGAEAVEAALKTAMLYSKKPAFASFKGAYHGLSIGALEVCGIEKFRKPFESSLVDTTLFLDFPRATAGVNSHIAQMRDALKARPDVGTVIVEPIQGRAGIIVPPKGFLPALRALCDELKLVLIFDEIYTGFGRTGVMFAADYEEVLPDIMCIGKAMADGFPISATIAKPEVMDAWEISHGEALHTSTYLGNPMGCAAALANIGEIERLRLPARARQIGLGLAARLDAISNQSNVVEVRGRGLMWGIELKDAKTAQSVVKNGLQKGLILLQAGEQGNLISITPPLTISEKQLYRAMDLVEELLHDLV